MKIRWLKPLGGMRHVGMVEDNDADLCKTWVDAGMAEYVKGDVKTHAQEVAEDVEYRRRPVESAVHESPVDRGMKKKGK